MKAKPKSLNEYFLETLKTPKKSATESDIVAELKTGRIQSIKEPGFKLAYDTIIEAITDENVSKEHARTIYQVYEDFGNLPALNARYGSFNHLIKDLSLHNTDIVSLFSYYETSIGPDHFIVVLTPYSSSLPIFHGEYFIKNGDKKNSFKVENTEFARIPMYADVQIGIKPKTKVPYIIKVKYPLSISCIQITKIQSSSNSYRDFLCEVKKTILNQYSDSTSVSEVFSQSIIESKSAVAVINKIVSDSHKKAVKRVIEYGNKKSGAH